MKLSSDTISILRNFAQINSSIYFRAGNKICTGSLAETIFGEATVSEAFESDFAIYDLSKFVSALSLHDNPDLNFTNSSYVSFNDGKRMAKYFFADPDVIKYKKEDIVLPSEDVCFILETKDLEKLLKASNTYRIFDLVVVGDGKDINLVVKDKNNPSSNEFSIVVGEATDVFNLCFRMENLKLIPGTYEVTISKDLLARFKSTKMDLTYYITLETDSTYED
jgi:hypothetical protein